MDEDVLVMDEDVIVIGECRWACVEGDLNEIFDWEIWLGHLLGYLTGTFEWDIWLGRTYGGGVVLPLADSLCLGAILLELSVAVLNGIRVRGW